MTKNTKPTFKKNRLSLLALEPRLVFDGAIATDTANKLSSDADLHLFDRTDVSPSTNGTTLTLTQAQIDAQRQIASWMQQSDAAQKIASIYGGATPSQESIAKAQALVDAFNRGEIHVRMELRSSAELSGVWGAFAQQGPDGQPVIYINADWLASSGTSTQDVSRVLTEEWGHFIDTQLNGSVDTQGDEGEAFANAVFGVQLTQQEQARIATENDQLWLTIDNQAVQVEMASLLFTGKVFNLTGAGTAGLEQNILPLYDALTDTAGIDITRTLFVSDPESGAWFSGNNVRGTLYTIDASNRVVASYYGEISRQVKIGSATVGLQMYVYPSGTTSTNTVSQTLLIDVNNTDAFSPAPNPPTSVNIGTSSDPIAAALNALLPKPVPAAATVDAAPALEAGGIANATPGASASGSVLTNDTGGTLSYRINKETNMLETVTSGLTVTKASSVGTGATGITAAGSTATSAYTSIVGLYGTLRIGADGTYTYLVDNNNAQVQALRTTANTLTESFNYSIATGTTVSSSQLNITVQGANDAPVAVNDYNVAKAPINPATVNWVTETVGFKATGNVLPNDTDVDAGDGKSLLKVYGTANVTTNGPTILGFSALNSSVSVGDFVFLDGTTKTPLRDAAGNQIKVASIDAVNKTFTLSGQVSNVPLGSGTTLGFSAKADASSGYKLTTLQTSTPGAAPTMALSGISGTVAVGMTLLGTGLATDPVVTAVTYDANGNVTGVTLNQSVSLGGQNLTFQALPGTTITGQYGTLNIGSDGAYTYTPIVNPGAGVTKVDSFQYMMQDTALAPSTATLYITVAGSTTFDPIPVADIVTAVEAGGVANATAGTNPTGNVLSNDNANGGTNSVTTIKSTQSAAETAVATSSSSTSNYTEVVGQYGTLRIGANGSYVYLVDNNNPTVQAMRTSGNSLSDTFQYKVINGTGGTAGSSYSLLTVNVTGANDAPVATADTNLAMANVSDATGNVLPNDTDVDAGDTKTVAKVAAGTTTTPSTTVSGSTTTASYGGVTYDAAVQGSYGTLYIKGDGTYRYVVDNSNPVVVALGSEQTVSEVFSYQMKDAGNLTSPTTLTVTVQGSNEAPVDGLPTNALEVTQGSSMSLTGVSTSDVDNNIAAVTVSVANGTLYMTELSSSGTGSALETTLTGGAMIYATSTGTVNGTSSITLYGTQAQINAALATLVYTPTSSFVGTDTFTITSIDSEGLTDTDTKSITVNPGQISINSISVNEGSPYGVFTVTGTAGQSISLALANVTATGSGTDYGSASSTTLGQSNLEYSLDGGRTWVIYSGTPPTLTGTTLLVRTPINNDTAEDNGETFTLTATPNGGSEVVGTATIYDNGTGQWFDGTSGTAATSGFVLNDDRPLTVNNIDVNEGSPYAVFTVTGAPGQLASLTLPTSGSATQATDYGSTLEYLDPADNTWKTYTSGTVALNSSGTLLVRTTITNDGSYEGNETFTLTATNTGNITSAPGTATIHDDGTGLIYQDNTTGNPDPYALPDDDRLLEINSVTVNEASPYAVFTITNPNTTAVEISQLTITNGTALLNLETSGVTATRVVQFYDPAVDNGDGTYGRWITPNFPQLVAASSPTSWTVNMGYFTAGQSAQQMANPSIAAGGQLLIRVVITGESDAPYEGVETFTVTATTSTSVSATGTGTIVDDGTGAFYPDNTTGLPDPLAVLNDDRPVQVDNIEVNEGSSYAVFTVTGGTNQAVVLGLQSDSNATTANAALGTDTGTQLQYFDGATWQNYTTGSTVNLINGQLLVRTTVQQDAVYEGPETFQLSVTTTGPSVAMGTATIYDDGTGAVYPDNTTGNPDPNAVLDDDRTLQISSVLVNENSPYMVFEVHNPGSTPLADVFLSLQNDNDPLTANATLGTDTGTGTVLQYFDGIAWVTYDATTSRPDIAQGATLLVRLAVTDDSPYEGAETLQLRANVSTASGPGSAFYGTGTIVDDGTGVIFPDNTTGNPDPNAVLDDDRPIQVDSIVVNEGSPYAVFTITGTAGQYVTLGLANDGDLATTDATLGTDSGTQLQYFNGTNWVNYTAGSAVAIPSTGLLVRMTIVNDSTYEGAEVFQLRATVSNSSGVTIGGTSVGTATIVDDGTGTIYPDNTTGAPDPNAVLDDDRAVQVDSITVNEGSPYGVFTVSATAGQILKLALTNDNDPTTADALLGIDTGTGALEYFNGTSWVTYNPTTGAVVPSSGELMVRFALTQDGAYEGPEALQLQVSNTAGTPYYGTATIVDDGTGAFYPNNTTGNPDPNAVLDDDREVEVNSIVVNEASPFAVFTVTVPLSGVDQYIKLDIQNDNDSLTANATLDTDTTNPTTSTTALEYFDGLGWQQYTFGTGVTLLSGQTSLLVRTAIVNDTGTPVYEGPETFILSATVVSDTSGANPAATTYGTGTIVDDGTGAIYPDNVTGNPDPNVVLDDDRQVQVNSITVNEGSPYGVFTVTGAAGQILKLNLTSDNDPTTADTTLGTDNATTLEYFNGTSWVSYDPTKGATVPAGGELLVRFAITQDTVYEGPEALQLQVTNTAGSAYYGTGTIVDDGTGIKYPDATPVNGVPVTSATSLDDDRSVKVNSITVNEASPYAVFTVTVPSSGVDQYLKLGIQNDNDPLTANATLGTDTTYPVTSGKPLQYLDASGNWVDYTPNTVVTIAANQTTLLVRTKIVNDTATPVYEGPEDFLLSATVTNQAGSTTGNTTYGTGTIVDDGTGAIYPDNKTGNPDPYAVLDDDRPIQVNSITVNEGSPYAVFTVTGAVGQNVTLGLLSDNDSTTADATLNTDTANAGTGALQYLDTTRGEWINYDPVNPPEIQVDGQLLVRTVIVNDSTYEGAEVFQLSATVSNASGVTTGGTNYGTGTIVDDGTGAIYPDNTTGNPDPNAVLDDDRAVQVNSITVNEGSPYGVFTVSAAAGQVLKLDLTNDNDPSTPNATLGADTGTALQYFNGSTWVPYDPNVGAVVTGNGELLVRFAINSDDVYEGPEALQLKVSNTAGTAYYGTGTIVDDGTGVKYPDATPVNGVPVTSTTSLDDDRTLQISSVTVNEASPYMVFEVKNPGSSALSSIYLNLQSDNDVLTANASLANSGGDVVPTLEYFSSGSWVPYGSGPVPTIAANGGTLLVRLAVNNDGPSVYEGAETLLLRANVGTSTGPAFYGTGTIVDDGTGSVFLATNNTATPNAPNSTDSTSGHSYAGVLDDDRPLAVNNIVVNEGSPYAVFEVTGAPGQLATLDLPTGGTATQNTDYGSTLEYLDPVSNTWQPYSSTVALDSTGTLLVRTTISNDPTYEGAETFTLTATNTGGSAATGTATIVDDGTGLIYQDNQTGTPDLNAPLNDDRELLINHVTVNEASPYMVFQVTNPGSIINGFTLNLQSDNNPTRNHALLGTDTDSTLQYLVGGSWVSTAPTSIATNETLYVRVAVLNDSNTAADFEGPETLLLEATVGINNFYGTGTIVDDGTGLFFPDNTTGASDPNEILNDDRPVSVNSITVNEASPFAVFTVNGTGNQGVVLSLQNDTNPLTVNADIGTDSGTILQYFNGGAWVVYSPGSTVNLINGELLVRTIVVNDDVYEGPEAFQLKVTPVGGTASVGTATIVDDGTGAVYPDNLSGNPDPNAVLDDDRSVQVNSITVNEASPYAVFTITVPLSTQPQYIQLGLQSDNDPLTANATLGADTQAPLSGGQPLQYLNASNQWVDYVPGTGVTLAAGQTTLLVRTAVVNDSANPVYEGPESFLLSATVVSDASGANPATTTYGSGTIVDDGTGAIYPDNTTGNQDPNAVLDDDRPVQVNNITVNEGSPYAVFTITGTNANPLSLSLQNDNDPLTADATLNTDTANAGSGALQYLNASGVWTDYNPSSPPTLINGQLLVRTAIVNDPTYEGAENFLLKVIPAGSTAAYGTATIVDDGTGAIYPDNTTGNPDPNAVLDDDRPVQVNSITVNEGSPYGVFTVTAAAGQVLRLNLGNDSDPTTPDATLGADTGTALQYFNGTNWVTYDPTAGVVVPSNGELLVRFAINQDTSYEGPEALQLQVSNTAGTAYYGTGTIVDDGTGVKYPDTVPTNGIPAINTSNLDDDRALQISSVTVNEGSPYMVFEVHNSGNTINAFTLSLQNDNDPLSANASLANTGGDVVPILEYFNGTSWSSSPPTTIAGNTTLLVRLALNNDTPRVYEGPETLLLKATVGANASYGTGTIIDDGTGSVFLATNNTATPDAPGSTDNTSGHAYAGVLDDDRTVKVNNIEVNEASPYAVFTVTGTEGTYVKLGLQNDNDVTTVNAKLGVDTRNAGTAEPLQYFDGAAWVDYTPGDRVLIPSGGLLVRAGVVNDAAYEGPEAFMLRATITNSAGSVNGMASYGTATILDDGTGNIFAGSNTTGIPDTPGINGVPALNDDRVIEVNNIRVNEASPWAVFNVTRPADAAPFYVTLGLQNDTDPATKDAELNTDTANAGASPLQYFDGTNWVDYAPGTPVLVPATGLMVRTAIVNDMGFEGAETFQLRVSPSSSTGVVNGTPAYGTASILDDGTGDIFNSDGTLNPSAAKNDDRMALNADKAPAPVMPAPLPMVSAPPADVHVQVAVAQAYAELRSPASFSISNTLSNTPAGGRYMVSLGIVQLDQFDRPTDPNLFVLPAVKQTRYEALEVQLPALLMQSGLLDELAMLKDSAGTRVLVSEAPTSMTLADRTLQALTEGEPSGETSTAKLAEIEMSTQEQQAARKQALHLMTFGETRASEVSAQQHSQRGQFNFSKQLQMSAAKRYADRAKSVS